ncbi:MAG: ATP-binding protein [Campylobacterota bacterium]|nr:ATP-binding protein [Campylobacterota bacterium]
MINLLDEYYKQNIYCDNYIERKIVLKERNYAIYGVTHSGKTYIVKNYLLNHKKGSYLYIDCSDIRLHVDELNKNIEQFCSENNISILVYDNYNNSIVIPSVAQTVIIDEHLHVIDGFTPLHVRGLDFEEFLAYEYKYDSTAINHLFKTGSLPFAHNLSLDTLHVTLQNILKFKLDSIEIAILSYLSQSSNNKISAFGFYEKIKSSQKISKDRLYLTLKNLINKEYIFQIEKLDAPRATKKLYLFDGGVKNALTVNKNFLRLFETYVFLEMKKSGFEIFYDEKIDFYIPKDSRVVLSRPFFSNDSLFKTIETIEAFLLQHNVLHVEIVTLSSEGTLNHPFIQAEVIPFASWAVIEGEE